MRTEAMPLKSLWASVGKHPLLRARSTRAAEATLLAFLHWAVTAGCHLSLWSSTTPRYFTRFDHGMETPRSVN